eukprot:jgi/Hompol1/5206/HPOL_004230-RA
MPRSDDGSSIGKTVYNEFKLFATSERQKNDIQKLEKARTFKELKSFSSALKLPTPKPKEIVDLFKKEKDPKDKEAKSSLPPLQIDAASKQATATTATDSAADCTTAEPTAASGTLEPKVTKEAVSAPPSAISTVPVEPIKGSQSTSTSPVAVTTPAIKPSASQKNSSKHNSQNSRQSAQDTTATRTTAASPVGTDEAAPAKPIAPLTIPAATPTPPAPAPAALATTSRPPMAPKKSSPTTSGPRVTTAAHQPQPSVADQSDAVSVASEAESHATNTTTASRSAFKYNVAAPEFTPMAQSAPRNSPDGKVYTSKRSLAGPGSKVSGASGNVAGGAGSHGGSRAYPSKPYQGKNSPKSQGFGYEQEQVYAPHGAVYPGYPQQPYVVAGQPFRPAMTSVQHPGFLVPSSPMHPYAQMPMPGMMAWGQPPGNPVPMYAPDGMQPGMPYPQAMYGGEQLPEGSAGPEHSAPHPTGYPQQMGQNAGFDAATSPQAEISEQQ